MSDKETIQYNFRASKTWRKQLEKIARTISDERDESLTYLDIIREAVEKILQTSGSILK